MQVLDRLDRGVAERLPALTPGVLGSRLQERQIVVEDVFDSQEHVAKTRAPHQRRQRGAMLRDRRRHALDGVIHVVETAVDDCLAQRFETADVERDVVVDEENGARAPATGVGDVGQHALDAVDVKIPPAHLDDRAEAAVVRAATRRLDDVNRTAQQRVSVEHPGAAIREPRRARCKPRNRPVGVEHEAVRRAIRKTSDVVEARPGFERAQELAQRLLAFSPDDELDVVARFVRSRRQAGIVSADDDPRPWANGANLTRNQKCRRALKRHDREADDVGLMIANEPIDRLSHAAVNEDEIGDRDRVLRIEIAGQRRQRAVRHAHRDRRHVLERIRHRQQQHIHGITQG